MHLLIGSAPRRVGPLLISQHPQFEPWQDERIQIATGTTTSTPISSAPLRPVAAKAGVV